MSSKKTKQKRGLVRPAQGVDRRGEGRLLAIPPIAPVAEDLTGSAVRRPDYLTDSPAALATRLPGCPAADRAQNVQCSKHTRLCNMLYVICNRCMYVYSVCVCVRVERERKIVILHVMDHVYMYSNKHIGCVLNKYINVMVLRPNILVSTSI